MDFVQAVQGLPLAEDGIGTCIAIHFNPYNAIQFLYRNYPQYKLIVRQVRFTEWRIWRLK